MWTLNKKSKGKIKNFDLAKKIKIILIIFFFIFPGLVWLYPVSSNTKIQIGIILTTEELINDGQYAMDGLNDFENIFSAKIIDVYFNDSQVRVKNGYYLTDDYFDKKFIGEIKKENQVEIVMFLTNKKIKNWLGDGMALWGIAETQLAATLVTAGQYTDNLTEHERYIRSTSIHEALHLLGYQHPTDDRKCIMQYAEPSERDLNPEYELELHYRVQFWRLGIGFDFVRASFLINLAILLVISPPFFELIIITHFGMKKILYKSSKISYTSLVTGLGILILAILIISAFFQYFYSKIILLISVIFIYLIIEILHYIYTNRKERRLNSL